MIDRDLHIRIRGYQMQIIIGPITRRAIPVTRIVKTRSNHRIIINAREITGHAGRSHIEKIPIGINAPMTGLVVNREVESHGTKAGIRASYPARTVKRGICRRIIRYNQTRDRRREQTRIVRTVRIWNHNDLNGRVSLQRSRDNLIIDQDKLVIRNDRKFRRITT